MLRYGNILKEGSAGRVRSIGVGLSLQRIQQLGLGPGLRGLYSNDPVGLAERSSEYAKPVAKELGKLDREIVLRVAVGAVLLGVLLNIFVIVALGFFVGEILLFAHDDTLNVEVMTLKVRSGKEKK